jgi:MFS family permease
MTSSDSDAPASNDAWYSGVTRSMWLVLAIASAGWIFDVYEGQIFNLTRNHMLGDILDRPADSPEVKKYGDFFLAVFLAGGTIGGLGFGFLADRFGRRPIMVVTILMYSLFSGLTYFASELWQVAVLRFLVATGVGGEWAVAASLVSEVFPARSRAHASAIFHASSILGTWMATLAAMWVGKAWYNAYLIGVLPALLILWVRSSVKETEQWEERRSRTDAPPMGHLPDLVSHPTWRKHAIYTASPSPQSGSGRSGRSPLPARTWPSSASSPPVFRKAKPSRGPSSPMESSRPRGEDSACWRSVRWRPALAVDSPSSSFRLPL